MMGNELDSLLNKEYNSNIVPAKAVKNKRRMIGAHVRFAVRLSVDLYNQLVDLADSLGGDNVSSIVRRLLTEGVINHKKGGKGK